SGTATLKSGNDTNIIGSQVKGEKVVADIGGNLNIVSQQDRDIFTSKNQSAGFGFGTDKISGTHGSVSAGKTNSEYNSVVEQAGIYAGKDGFDITVEKNTDLTGAVISSEAPAVKNALKTGTITFSNLENRAKYQANSVGVGYAAGKDANGNDVAKKDQGLTPNIGVTASGEDSSTTKSAISPGTIEVRSNPNQDLSGLSRDPEGAVNALGKIFDKKTVQEKQELAKVFGEVAYEEIHKLSVANAWVEGGPEKTALHALVGGLMAQMGGGSFGSGAVGAGVNEAIQGELAKIKDPALHQWASALVGAAAAKTVGGNAQTGVSTAVSGTKNNFLVAVPVVIEGVEVLVAATVLATPEGKKLVDATGKVIGTWIDETHSWVSNKYQQYITSSTYEDAIDNSLPTNKHTVSERRSLPKTGEPNSSVDLLNPDGSVKQRRYYDKDGNADWDVDYNHSDDGTHTFPHKHKWGEDGRGDPE
ncbi:hemagglutinin repeat-containing protein, partial [Sporomusa malonica]